jgi:2-(1,2-epoxy-1,2-dihydrophenyl)acetyl-CoA isomerase
MEEIIYEVKNNIAFITLNRPEKYNSFTRSMAFLLQDKLDEAEADVNVRAVLITGAGKAFCAGQDLEEATGPEFKGFSYVVGFHYNPIVQKIVNMPKPVIAAVNGVAAGAGANLALACDIVIASESASFIQAFSKIGLVPDTGGTFFLPRLIGQAKATALMMLGDKVSAKDADNMGMIYKYFPDDTFQKELQKTAEQLAQMPTKALGFTKRLLHISQTSQLNEQLDAEGSWQHLSGQTADYTEGINAFLEKRKPNFTGK